MNFNEAMKKLESGSKVTRQQWVGNVYFAMKGEDVKCYQPQLTAYSYDEDIMISDGWIIEDLEGEHKFYDIIDHLIKGKRAYRDTWKEKYIFFDKESKILVVHSMAIFPYALDFVSFVASDWVEV